MLPGTHDNPASHAQAHLGRLLARVHVEALMQGNLSAADAAELAEAVCAALPGAQMAAAERPVEEVAVLPEGHSLLLRHAVSHPTIPYPTLHRGKQSRV